MSDTAPTPAHLDRATVDGLVQLARDLAGTDDLPTMLSIFSRAIRDVADFECTIINLVNDAGDLQVVAASGPPGLEQTLLGTVGSRAGWDAELAIGERYGAVLLTLDLVDECDLPVWVSDDVDWFARTAGDPRAWRPEYAAYVPIYEPNGELLGVISVDMPRSGLIPGHEQLATLEVLARQAEAAVVSARTIARSVLDGHVYGSVFEVGGSPMGICDEVGRLTQTNRRFRDAFGDIDQLAGFDALITSIEDSEGLAQEAANIFAGRAGAGTFVAGTGSLGELRWFHVALRGVAYDGSVPARVVCTMTDITAERRVREQFRHDSLHDQLTGLLNRRGTREANAEMLTRSVPDQLLVAMFADLDRFKLANDLHGHQFGDQVLVDVAVALRAAVPEPAVMGRAGGDEFVVLTWCESSQAAEKLADAVVAAVAVPLPDSVSERVTISVGMAIGDASPAGDVIDLMHAADDALYEAKLAGGARWVQANTHLAR